MIGDRGLGIADCRITRWSPRHSNRDLRASECRAAHATNKDRRTHKATAVLDAIPIIYSLFSFSSGTIKYVCPPMFTIISPSSVKY